MELANTALTNGNANVQIKKILGKFTKDNQTMTENIPSVDMSRFNCSRYKFFLNAPFEISNICCREMKKNPAHKYQRETGRKPITAQMADESRLRLQKWLQHGCNAWNSKNPISNPMSFWTEQDVLRYIHENNLPIAPVYGDIIVKGAENGQMSIQDMLGDYRDCEFETTGCDRTGCMFCGYGCHLEKSGQGRFERMKQTHPRQYEWIMGGGEFSYTVKRLDGTDVDFGKASKEQIAEWCENHIGDSSYRIKKQWLPNSKGMGYKFVIDWINEHGNLNIRY